MSIEHVEYEILRFREVLKRLEREKPPLTQELADAYNQTSKWYRSISNINDRRIKLINDHCDKYKKV